MKKYMEPAIEVVEFNVEDVITTSFDAGQGGLPVAP